MDYFLQTSSNLKAYLNVPKLKSTPKLFPQESEFLPDSEISISDSEMEYNQDIKKIIERWVGNTVVMAVDNSRKQKNQSDARLVFAYSIIEEYRQFIISLEENQIKHRFTSQLEQTFQNAVANSMDFLHFQCAPLGQTITSSKQKYHNNEMNLKYNYLLKTPEINFNSNRPQVLRVNLKKLINQLVNHSQNNFKHFNSKIGEFFSQFQNCSQFVYATNKRIDSAGFFKKQEENTPAFFKINKQVLKILMEWIDDLLSYFKKPARTLKNINGFCSKSGQIIKLIQRQKKILQGIFHQRYQVLQRNLKLIQRHLRKTISNIILISKSPIRSQQKQPPFEVNYLDKEEVSIVIICQYISKAMNDYVIDILTTIIIEIQCVEQQFYVASREDDVDKLSLLNFMIPNLFKCRCEGSSQDVQKIMQKFNSQKNSKNSAFFQILRVINRMDSNQKDIIVNLLIKDPEISCYFICQIQLSVSSKSRYSQFNFSNFLHELSSSTYGMIAQLGLYYHNIDFKHQYVVKKKLAFQNKSDEFKIKNGKLVCAINQNHGVKQSKSHRSYICNQCFKFVHAYLYYFPPQKCKQCGVYLCFICYLNLYKDDNEKKSEIILQKLPYIKRFFEYAEGPYLFNKPKSAQEQIKRLLKKNKQCSSTETNPYLGILTFKNNTNHYSLDLVKLVTIDVDFKKSKQERQKAQKSQTQQLVLTSFNNKQFDFNCTSDICLILSKRNLINQTKTSKQQYLENIHQFMNLHDIHRYFVSKNYDQYKVWGKSTQKQKSIVVDYIIGEGALFDITSDNAIIKKLTDIKQSNIAEHSFEINKQAINFTFFDLLSNQEKQKIKNVTVSQGKPHDYQKIEDQFKLLQSLTALEKIEIEKTLNFFTKAHLPNLKQIYLKKCKLKQFDFDAYPLIETIHIKQIYMQTIPKLNLPYLALLELLSSKISNLDSFVESSVPNLNRLNIQHSKITNFPLFPSQKFQNLQILELRNNQIKNIANIKDSVLPKLRYLILEKNKIQNSFPSVSHFQKLEYLQLSNNQITGIQRFDHKTLKSIKANTNKLLCVPQVYCQALEEVLVDDNNIIESQELSRVISQVYTIVLQINNNPNLKTFPLVETKIGFIKVEVEKLLFQIQDLWQNKIILPNSFFCNKCKQTPKTYGIYCGLTQKTKELDYCKQCYDNKLSDSEKQNLGVFVLVPGDYINRNV